MKKHNLKKIMTRAWEIKKQDRRNDFGCCLRMAWEEETMNQTNLSSKALELYKNPNLIIRYNEMAGKLQLSVANESYANNPTAVALKSGKYNAELLEIKAMLAGKAAEEKAERAARIREEDARIATIEGLDELEAARAAWSNYHQDFARRMNSESASSFAGKQPEADISALEARYPRAAAYIKARAWSLADHPIKSGSGKTAMYQIINGADYAAAITAMEKTFADYCEANND